MSKRSEFKSGSGCYTCKGCGKKTRATGQSEENVDLCARCYERGGIENEHLDTGGKHDGAELPVENCPLCEEATAKAAAAAAATQTNDRKDFDRLAVLNAADDRRYIVEVERLGPAPKEAAVIGYELALAIAGDSHVDFLSVGGRGLSACGVTIRRVR